MTTQIRAPKQFALRQPMKRIRLDFVETTRLTTIEKEAFGRLLDDTSPAVRTALLAEFERLGPEGSRFLRDVAGGSNRVAAAAAAWYLRELKFYDPAAEFRGFIRSLSYELETGMLLLNRTVNASLDVTALCLQLDALAARCLKLRPETASLREHCDVLNRVLFQEFGLRGDPGPDADPRNGLLDQVLARRLGLPVSLSIVYLLVARRTGLELEPVSVPGHFLVGCYEPEGPFYIDAFNQGRFLSPDDVFARLRSQHHTPQLSDLVPSPVREVLCRCCRELATQYAVVGDREHARLFAGFVAEFEAAYERHARP
jgi:regulator of sirC expression with transglutaminase-like and TPR domain